MSDVIKEAYKSIESDSSNPVWWDIADLDISRVQDVWGKLKNAVKDRDEKAVAEHFSVFLAQVHELTHILPIKR